MAPSRPNIVFIMADDHAAKAISAYGYGINHTPNLDRIAKNGMLFNHCYVTNSICTPSRATILTGTHNHTNGVRTLASTIDTHLPNAAKQLRTHGGYTTGMFGKWHLGEGKAHQPSGFDEWEIVRGQGEYYDPVFDTPTGPKQEIGYATDIITDKTLAFIENRDVEKPFFVMCHHKAPHRAWEFDVKHKNLYTDPIKIPETFDDDYKNRAKAVLAFRNKIRVDMTYQDLGIIQPEGGKHLAGEPMAYDASWIGANDRKVPQPDTDEEAQESVLIDRATGENFRFTTVDEVSKFKYQRYMQRYLRTIQSIDDNVGRLLDYLEEKGLAENTMVVYTSDQGFFLGEHGWFDKRFIYEESFQMPYLVCGPGIKAGSVCNDIVSNVDFAPTWLDFAGVTKPSYMQGESFLPMLKGTSGEQDEWEVAYHRYWMHRDVIHNCYAHYGVRSKRYKIIFWYNENYDLPGTLTGGQEQEWELYDCERDPMELFNVWGDKDYSEIMEKMVRLLEAKMAEIGDTAAHPLGLPASELAGMYVPGADIASRAEQHNLGI